MYTQFHSGRTLHTHQVCIVHKYLIQRLIKKSKLKPKTKQQTQIAPPLLCHTAHGHFSVLSYPIRLPRPSCASCFVHTEHFCVRSIIRLNHMTRLCRMCLRGGGRLKREHEFVVLTPCGGAVRNKKRRCFITRTSYTYSRKRFAWTTSSEYAVGI